jgi:hypothetical protein
VSSPVETGSRAETAAIPVERVVRWLAVAGLVIATTKIIGDIRWLGQPPLHTRPYGFGSISQQVLYYWGQLPELFPAVIWFDSVHGFHSVMGLIHFLMPIILLVGCCGVLCGRGGWARSILLLYAVLWLCTNLLGLAFSIYAASATVNRGFPIGVWTQNELTWMEYQNQPWVMIATWAIHAVFPIALVYLLTRPAVKALFHRRRRLPGFEPVMRKRA